MSDQTTPSVPAGWYPDPDAPGQGRYWDGTAWTEHRHLPGQPLPALRAPAGTDPSTPWIWIMALLPLVNYALLPLLPWQDYIRSTLTSPSSPSGVLDLYTSPLMLGSFAISFVMYAAYVVLALADHRALVAKGIPKPFHWAFTFIPSYGGLIYLIGRSVVVKSRTGGGLGPLWLTIAIFVLGIIASFVLVGVLFSYISQSYPY